MAGSKYIPQGAVYIPEGATPVNENKKGTIASLPIIGSLAPRATKYVDTLVNTIENTGSQLGDIYQGQFGSPQEKKAAGRDFIVRQQQEDQAKAVYSPVNSIKTGAEISQYIPITGASALPRIATGVLRGTMHTLSKDNQGVGDYAKNAALTATGEVVLPEVLDKVGKVLKSVSRPVTSVLRNPTMRSAGRNVGKGAQAATERGASVGWNEGEGNLSDQIIKAVRDKIGYDTEVRDVTTNFLAGQTPTPGTIGTGGNMRIAETTLTPNDLLATRSKLSAKYGKDIFGRAIDSNVNALELKVAQIARNVVSKNLHKLAPETLPPDVALSIYHGLPLGLGKLGLPGIVVEAILGAKGAEAVKKVLPMIGVNP